MRSRTSAEIKIVYFIPNSKSSLKLILSSLCSEIRYISFSIKLPDVSIMNTVDLEILSQEILSLNIVETTGRTEISESRSSGVTEITYGGETSASQGMVEKLQI